jgi:hypothetical protein
MAGDPLPGTRRVAGVEVIGGADALERVGGEDGWRRDVVLLPQVEQAAGEPGEGPVGDLHRLRARRGQDHVPRDPQRRQGVARPAKRCPLIPVRAGQLPHPLRRDQRHHRHPQARAPACLRQRPGAVPQGRVGLLHRPRHDGCIGQRVVLAGEGDAVRRHSLPQDLQGLVESLLRLRLAGHPVECQLGRRHASPDAQVKPPASELVEGSRLLDDAHRVVQRQDRDQRPEPQPRGRSCRRREHQVGRAGDGQRRPVMLGQVVGVEPQPVVGLDEPQPLLDLLDVRPSGVVIVVDDPESHIPDGNAAHPGMPPPVCAPPAQAGSRR